MGAAPGLSDVPQPRQARKQLASNSRALAYQDDGFGVIQLPHEFIVIAGRALENPHLMTGQLSITIERCGQQLVIVGNRDNHGGMIARPAGRRRLPGTRGIALSCAPDIPEQGWA